jgi:hypothetical protein
MIEIVSEPPQRDLHMTFLRVSLAKKGTFRNSKRWTLPKYLNLADLDGSNTDSRM